MKNGEWAARKRRTGGIWTLGAGAVILVSLGSSVALGSFASSSEQKFIPYNTFGTVTASCPHGQHVNFGGFKTDTIVPFQAKQNLWPASMGAGGRDTNKWTTVAASPSIGGGKLTSIAYCKGGAEPKVVTRKKIVLQSAANDELRRVSVSCPRGKKVIGGGWSARTASPLYSTDDSQPYLDIMGLQRTSNRTWQVSVVNQRPKQHAVTAIALCGKGAAPRTSVATVKFPASGSSTMKTATATCPGRTEVVFGGFKGDFDSLSGRNAFVFGFYRSSKKAISVRGGQNYVFGNTQSSKLQAIAYCR